MTSPPPAGAHNMRNPAVKRILQEMKEFHTETSRDVVSAPLEDNIFEWQFAIRGAADTEYEGGLFHGRILLPAEYPFKPPSFMMQTPNGRFEVGTKLCLSISQHHPEHWQPSWSVRTALMALIAFMPSAPDGAIGGLSYPPDERRSLAALSRKTPPKVVREASLFTLPATPPNLARTETMHKENPIRQKLILELHQRLLDREALPASSSPVPALVADPTLVHSAPAAPAAAVTTAAASSAPASPACIDNPSTPGPSPAAVTETTTEALLPPSAYAPAAAASVAAPIASPITSPPPVAVCDKGKSVAATPDTAAHKQSEIPATTATAAVDSTIGACCDQHHHYPHPLGAGASISAASSSMDAVGSPGGSSGEYGGGGEGITSPAQATSDRPLPPAAAATSAAALAAARKEEATLNWIIALLVGAIVALVCRKASFALEAATAASL